MKKTVALTAVAVSLSMTALGGSAYAQVSPADQASPLIEVTKADKTGDVRVFARGPKAPSARVKRSIAMNHVDYRIDRTAETLSITYPLRRVLGGDRFHQVVVTLIASDKDAGPWGTVFSVAGTSRVRVFMDADEPTTGGRCEEGVSVTDAAADTVTQTVPFSCLADLDHGLLRSAAMVERRGGADISWDVTPFIRDVPLTAYVEPTEPPPAG
jgi:hypothetical protein